MVEETVLDGVLELFPALSGRKLTEDYVDDIEDSDPPDFVIGLDGRALGVRTR